MSSSLHGQDLSGTDSTGRFAEEVYGLFSPDQQLVNGVQYIYRYQHCLGQPYFWEEQLHRGSLTLSGRVFGEMLMNYDLVTQDLELEYAGSTGMSNRIIVVPDFVEEFTIGPYLFRKMAIGDSLVRYYQVVSTPRFTCYIHWFKRLIPVADNLNYLNECTDADQIFWLEMEGRTNGFRNRKSYLSCFPESMRKEIRRMLNRSQVRLKGASVEELVRIFRETSQILEEGGSG